MRDAIYAVFYIYIWHWKRQCFGDLGRDITPWLASWSRSLDNRYWRRPSSLVAEGWKWFPPPPPWWPPYLWAQSCGSPTHTHYTHFPPSKQTHRVKVCRGKFIALNCPSALYYCRLLIPHYCSYIERLREERDIFTVRSVGFFRSFVFDTTFPPPLYFLFSSSFCIFFTSKPAIVKPDQHYIKSTIIIEK